MALDLTAFGFTPTESLVYEVLLRGGPGSGYAIARSAGLARANTYGALEGLVQKGAARVEDGRPKRYRPEPPATLVARILERQGRELDEVGRTLDQLTAPVSPTLIELSSPRAVLQLASREAARARKSIVLHATADAFPPLVPALRKAAGSGVVLSLSATSPVELPFGLEVVGDAAPWPGQPFVMVVDGRSAMLVEREGERVSGYWGTASTMVASAQLAIERMRQTGASAPARSGMDEAHPDAAEQQLLRELRREYVQESPARLEELRGDLEAARQGLEGALVSLKSNFHRLAGSGGSYGLPAITEASRSAENWLAQHAAPDAEGFAYLEQAIERVAAAFQDAEQELRRG